MATLTEKEEELLKTFALTEKECEDDEEMDDEDESSDEGNDEESYEEAMAELDADEAELSESILDLSNVKVDVSDFGKLMESEEGLTEEAKTKIVTMFEAVCTTAVKTRLTEAYNLLRASTMLQLHEEIENLEALVDRYASSIAEQWLADNQIALESAAKVKQAEGIMEDIKSLLVSENALTLAEHDETALGKANVKIEGLTESLNKSIKETTELKEQIAGLQRAVTIREAVEGLSEMEASKLRSLAESVEFVDAETFGKKVAALKESVKAPKAKALTEEVVPAVEEAPKAEKVSKSMETYLKFARQAAANRPV